MKHYMNWTFRANTTLVSKLALRTRKVHGLPCCLPKKCKDDVKLALLLFTVVLTVYIPLAQLLLPTIAPMPLEKDKLLSHGMSDV